MSEYILWAISTQPKHYIFCIYKQTLNKKSSFGKKILKGRKRINIFYLPGIIGSVSFLAIPPMILGQI